MPTICIDGQDVSVPRGATLLRGAEKLGIDIPTLCYLKDRDPLTSCMVCMVEIEGRPDPVPACSTPAVEGMRVCTNSESVFAIRRAALELLLSEHLGDCMGPCQMACPAHMDIPLMIRQIAADQMADALVTVKQTIALPAVLGRICPAPCEKVCRRAHVDEAVSICLLKRAAADANPTYVPPKLASKGKRIAIVGAGPAGLAAAMYLQCAGYDCTVFDDREQPGGQLRYGVPEAALPRSVLDAEIDTLRQLGVTFTCGMRIGTDLSLAQLQQDYAAVYVAVGALQEAHAEELGLPAGKNGLVFDRKTYQTEQAGVFVGGDCIRARKLAIRSCADGKEAAVAIDQYCSSNPVTGPAATFNTRMGKLQKEELQQLLDQVNSGSRIGASEPDGGYTQFQASAEAARCLHCDCRKQTSCKLRQYSQVYGANPTRYKTPRADFSLCVQHPEVIHEPGKCIKCGLCVKITAEDGEDLGLTFIGRGFQTRITAPLDKSMAEALTKTAQTCVEACPTGALAFRD
jgi:ferredoxin